MKQIPQLTTNVATNYEVSRYKSQQQSFLYTTRFNNETYQNNREFCKRCGLKGIYCVLTPLPETIPLQSVVYVLEMNNETKKIIAIGKIINERREEVYRVYSKENYNQKHYRVKKRKEVESMTNEQQNIILQLEYHCFYTKGHLKRGQGLTAFPWLKLTTSAKNGFDIIRYIETILGDSSPWGISSPIPPVPHG